MPEGEPKNTQDDIPERTSGIMKVVGVSSEKEGKLLESVQRNIFEKQDLMDGEIEKSPENKKISFFKKGRIVV